MPAFDLYYQPFQPRSMTPAVDSANTGWNGAEAVDGGIFRIGPFAGRALLVSGASNQASAVDILAAVRKQRSVGFIYKTATSHARASIRHGLDFDALNTLATLTDAELSALFTYSKGSLDPGVMGLITGTSDATEHAARSTLMRMFAISMIPLKIIASDRRSPTGMSPALVSALVKVGCKMDGRLAPHLVDRFDDLPHTTSTHIHGDGINSTPQGNWANGRINTVFKAYSMAPMRVEFGQADPNLWTGLDWSKLCIGLFILPYRGFRFDQTCYWPAMDPASVTYHPVVSEDALVQINGTTMTVGSKVKAALHTPAVSASMASLAANAHTGFQRIVPCSGIAALELVKGNNAYMGYTLLDETHQKVVASGAPANIVRQSLAAVGKVKSLLANQPLGLAQPFIVDLEWNARSWLVVYPTNEHVGDSYGTGITRDFGQARGIPNNFIGRPLSLFGLPTSMSTTNYEVNALRTCFHVANSVTDAGNFTGAFTQYGYDTTAHAHFRYGLGHRLTNATQFVDSTHKPESIRWPLVATANFYMRGAKVRVDEFIGTLTTWSRAAIDATQTAVGIKGEATQTVPYRESHYLTAAQVVLRAKSSSIAGGNSTTTVAADATAEQTTLANAGKGDGDLDVRDAQTMMLSMHPGAVFIHSPQLWGRLYRHFARDRTTEPMYEVAMWSSRAGPNNTTLWDWLLVPPTYYGLSEQDPLRTVHAEAPGEAAAHAVIKGYV